MHPLLELIAERDLPVLIHSGHPIFTLPWSIEELAVAFPTVRIIMAHMGHGNVVYINAAIDIAERRPNVYLETSGMPMHTKIREAVERVGPTRVLYGSDVPLHHPQVEILKVRLSGLPPELVDRVLSANGRLFFFGANGTDSGSPASSEREVSPGDEEVAEVPGRVAGGEVDMEGEPR